MCSPRALVAPPLPVTRIGCLIEEAHSRDQRCPANYHTLINRTRVARDSISPLSPAVSRPPPHLPTLLPISLFRTVAFSFLPVFRRPYHRPPTVLPPFLFRFTRVVRTASVRFDSPRVSRIGSFFAPADCGRRFRRTAHRCSQVSCETCSNSVRQSEREKDREREGERERERGKRKTTKHDPPSRRRLKRYRRKPVAMILSALAKIGAKC